MAYFAGIHIPVKVHHDAPLIFEKDILKPKYSNNKKTYSQL